MTLAICGAKRRLRFFVWMNARTTNKKQSRICVWSKQREKGFLSDEACVGRCELPSKRERAAGTNFPSSKASTAVAAMGSAERAGRRRAKLRLDNLQAARQRRRWGGVSTVSWMVDYPLVTVSSKGQKADGLSRVDGQLRQQDVSAGDIGQWWRSRREKEKEEARGPKRSCRLSSSSSGRGRRGFEREVRRRRGAGSLKVGGIGRGRRKKGSSSSKSAN